MLTYIDVTIKTRPVLRTIIWVVVLGGLVSPIEFARGPIIPYLALQFATT